MFHTWFSGALPALDTEANPSTLFGAENRDIVSWLVQEWQEAPEWELWPFTNRSQIVIGEGSRLVR